MNSTYGGDAQPGNMCATCTHWRSKHSLQIGLNVSCVALLCLSHCKGSKALWHGQQKKARMVWTQIVDRR
eukprot:2993652-Karenia_brevis.AAC.1